MSGGHLLCVADLRVAYDGIPALRGISFDVPDGEIVTLIGANGAGKSTTLRALSGIVAYEGSVTFAGEELRGLSPRAIAARGLVHVPEGRGIFGNLTVMENLRLATWPRKDRGRADRELDRVFALFPRLRDRVRQSAGTLSGGEQQMLAVGRALMARGRILLLDEPSMGLAPLLVRDIFRALAEINREGTTILLVEQNANMALKAASRAYLLEAGAVKLAGPADQVLGNQKIREAYLGARHGE